MHRQQPSTYHGKVQKNILRWQQPYTFNYMSSQLCLQQTARDHHIAHRGIQSSSHNPRPAFTQTHTGKHTMCKATKCWPHIPAPTHPTPVTLPQHPHSLKPRHAHRLHVMGLNGALHITHASTPPPRQCLQYATPGHHTEGAMGHGKRCGGGMERGGKGGCRAGGRGGW